MRNEGAFAPNLGGTASLSPHFMGERLFFVAQRATYRLTFEVKYRMNCVAIHISNPRSGYIDEKELVCWMKETS